MNFRIEARRRVCATNFVIGIWFALAAGTITSAAAAKQNAVNAIGGKAPRMLNQTSVDTLAECTSMGYSLHKALSNVRSKYFLWRARWQQYLGNTAEENLVRATQVDPCNTLAYFSLGLEQLKQNDLAGAVQSFEAAILLDPRDKWAHALHAKAERQFGQAEFWTILVTAMHEQPELRVSNDTGYIVMPLSPSNQKLAEARMKQLDRVLEYWTPMRMAMNLDKYDDEQLQQILRTEMKEFREAAGGLKGGQRGHPIAEKLQAALRNVRELENSTTWLLPWAVDRVRYFHTEGRIANEGAYGTNWFTGWQRIFSHPSVTSAMSKVRHKGSARVFVVGSGLGYQCLFALASGAGKCVGYEVLCGTLVRQATSIVAEQELDAQISFKCADAREFVGVHKASVVWINDQSFSGEFRAALFRRLALELKPRAVVTTYHAPTPELVDLDAFVVEAQIRVEVSWSYTAPMWLLRKRGPSDEMAGPAKRSSAKVAGGHRVSGDL